MNYIYYFGIDISKKTFDTAQINTDSINGTAQLNRIKTEQFSNDMQGIKAFCKKYKEALSLSFIVMESTGGYENMLLSSLLDQGYSVHRADPLNAKNFIKSLGKRAKTDVLDSQALARYAQERHQELSKTLPLDKAQAHLKALESRRDDLVLMRTQERQRLQHPTYIMTISSVKAHLKQLDSLIKQIEQEMKKIIESSQTMKAKAESMLEFKGVGQRTATAILAVLPEIGTLNRKKIAALAGCAPHPRDSGTTHKYRHTHGGRANLKKALFMAALSATRYNPKIKTTYDSLILKGKKPMVAMVAVMRKMIVILNAIIRDNIIQQHGR